MTLALELKGEALGEKKNSHVSLKNSSFQQTECSNLKSALTTGNENEYKKALLLEKLRDALLEQTEFLMNNVTDDIFEKSRALAPRVFGWNNETIPGLSPKRNIAKTALNSDRTNYESAWEKLRALETQSYRLEDPGIANDFFDDIQEMLISDEVNGVNQKHLIKYPWLLPRSGKLISRPVCIIIGIDKLFFNFSG